MGRKKISSFFAPDKKHLILSTSDVIIVDKGPSAVITGFRFFLESNRNLAYGKPLGYLVRAVAPSKSETFYLEIDKEDESLFSFTVSFGGKEYAYFDSFGDFATAFNQYLVYCLQK